MHFLHNLRLEKFIMDKYCDVLGPFVNYEENKMCTHLKVYSHYFIIFVTYEWIPKVRMFVSGKPFQTNVT
jgi:hypothetical protein